MREIISPDPSFGDRSDIRGFLAGSIEQNKAVMWQPIVCSAVDNYKSTRQVTLFNPRRTFWDPSWVQSITNPEFAFQVNWELDRIERSDFFFFYFQGDTLSPISLLEFGKVVEMKERVRDLKIILVCEPNFWRIGNIEIVAQRSHIPVLRTLDDGIASLLDYLTIMGC